MNERSEQGGAREWVNGAREQVNKWASVPVYTSRILAVLNHNALPGEKRRSRGRRRGRGRRGWVLAGEFDIWRRENISRIYFHQSFGVNLFHECLMMSEFWIMSDGWWLISDEKYSLCYWCFDFHHKNVSSSITFKGTILLCDVQTFNPLFSSNQWNIKCSFMRDV